MLWQVGGFDGSTGLNSAEMFDPRQQKWTMIASMSTRRSSVGVGVVNNLLYAVSFTYSCLSLVWIPLNTIEKDNFKFQKFCFMNVAHVAFLRDRLEAMTEHQGSVSAL